MVDTTRRNGPGLLRLLVLVPLLVGALALTAWLGAEGHPAVWAAAVFAGLVLFGVFPVLHESGHQTAFRSRALNDAVAWPAAVLMLQAPTFFREFHWAHHRHTQDPKLDPEIAMNPAMLAPFPRNPVVYLMLATGQSMMVGKLGFTVGSLFAPNDRVLEKLFPFIRPHLRARVRWESAVTLGGLGAGATLGLLFVPGFAWALLAWPFAHVFLGLYVMAEHTGLPHEGTQLERTRTTPSNGLVRFFMWNMNLHAEHHAHPAVPFHALPALHAQLRPTLPHRMPGYAAFHGLALRHAVGLAPRESAPLPSDLRS